MAMSIGFVGLGTIGTEMAKRLLEDGHDVTVYARGAGRETVRAAGARETGDYAALAAQSDALILIVFDDDQVRDILFDRGVLRAMRPGSVLTIHVTGSPLLRREIQGRAPVGVEVLDVAFSGSAAAVEQGTITLIAGGNAAALERMRPAFSTYAKEIFHVGEVGDAQVIKLLNNLILAANMLNAAELLKAASSYGFDAKTAVQVIQACSGSSFAMGIFGRTSAADAMTTSRRYIEKDVKEAVSSARDVGMDLSAFRSTIDHYLP